MNFDRAFKLSSHLLVSVGVLSLFAAGGIGLILLSAYLLGVYISLSDRVLQLDKWVQRLSFVLILSLLAIDLSFFSGLISAIVHLLVFITILKLVAAKGDRDYLLLYLLSFAFLLLASTFTISLLFLLSLIGFLFFSILTFILFENKKAYERNRSADFSIKGYVQATVVITASIVLISIPIFLAIPRSSLGFLGGGHLNAQNLSGFSNTVVLGDIGRIISSPDIVMRVEVDTEVENLARELKWRGIALDHYDGRSWRSTNSRGKIRKRGGVFLVAERSRGRDEEFLVRQTFMLEPFSDIIFGAPRMIQIAGLRRVSDLEEANDSFFLGRRGRSRLRYTVDSDLITRSDRMNRFVEGEIPDAIKKRYLQLPEDIHFDIRSLARELTGRQDNPMGKALILEQYLRSNYKYSLENTSAVADDPLHDFLFGSREGHCEFFATAQAVMMRAANIPSRVVNGFRRGEYNEWSERFIVRQSDAHSWVEGYFPDLGWVEFDPTPPGNEGSSPYVVRLASHLIDSLDVFWTELVTFDQQKQVGFFRGIASAIRYGWGDFRELSADIREQVRSFRPDGLLSLRAVEVVFLVSGVLLMTLSWFCFRNRAYLRALWKRRVGRLESSDLAPDYYVELLEVMRRKGYVKRSSETPAEFAVRIAPDFLNPLPAQVTELYYRHRFGSARLGAHDLSGIYASLRRLRRNSRSSL
ncbi:MAG: transglutaminase TgpA family protein [Acidobacteriota bacterium]